MSNLRFHHQDALRIAATVKLNDNAATHATRVLRLNVNDEIVLFDGSGSDYHCQITSIKKNEVLAQVKSSIPIHNESPLNITLLQGISSGDRMDYTIQKAVELGVNRIIPIKTERSVVKLSSERAEKRLEHWTNVAISACEQSGRATIPVIESPTSLASWLSSNPTLKQLRITLDPTAMQGLNDLQEPQGEVQLLIGAEGGLSKDEIALAAQHGFIGVQLGKRILRTETAPLAAMAAMQLLWGDYGM